MLGAICAIFYEELTYSKMFPFLFYIYLVIYIQRSCKIFINIVIRYSNSNLNLRVINYFMLLSQKSNTVRWEVQTLIKHVLAAMSIEILTRDKHTKIVSLNSLCTNKLSLSLKWQKALKLLKRSFWTFTMNVCKGLI